MTKSLAGYHVLVVEDEMMIMLGIEDVLFDFGCHDVTTAATVDDALGFIKARTFDVAILDVNLGQRTSYPVAEALAARGVPFVFSTGYGDHGVEQRFRDRPVLRKPYRDKDLAAMLSSLVSASDKVPALL